MKRPSSPVVLIPPARAGTRYSLPVFDPRHRRAVALEAVELCEQVDERAGVVAEVIRATADEQDAPGLLFVDGDQGDRDI